MADARRRGYGSPRAEAQSRRRACTGRRAVRHRPAQTSRLTKGSGAACYPRPAGPGTLRRRSICAASPPPEPLGSPSSPRSPGACRPALRPVGAVRLAADRGARPPGPPGHAVRQRRLGDGGRAGIGRARGVVGGPSIEPKVAEAPPHRLGVRAGRRVRRHPQRLRLPAPQLQPVWSDPGGDHGPRLLVAAASFRPTSGTTPRRASWPSATPTATRACTTPPPSTTASAPTRLRASRAPATTSCSSGASTRRRARPWPSRSPAGPGAGWSSPGSSRTRPASTPRSRLTSTASASSSSGRSAAVDARAALGRAHALLHLIDFDEPFGFSIVEAMACGAPVIAYRPRIDAGS